MSTPLEKGSLQTLTVPVVLRRLTRMLIVCAVIAAPMLYAKGRYEFVFDGIKGVNCVPYSVFIVDLTQKQVRRGDYVAFISQQMEPFYKNGTRGLKIVAAEPGDHFVVDDRGVSVNGKYWGPLVHVQRGGKLWELGHRAAEYARNESVPAGKLAVLGTYERSYDSRYWGYIATQQVLGRAIPLF